MKNRFSELFHDLEKNNKYRGKKIKTKKKTHVAQAYSKEEKCPQMSETVVGDDEFVLDILAFFFHSRLRPSQLNDELREIAAKMLWSALEASKNMDLVPRPPKGVPSPKWLIGEAVQIAFRRANNNCKIYEAVRKTVARNFRSAYEIAKLTGSQAQSFSLKLNYHIPGPFNVIAQPSSMACWATVFTMLYSWKLRKSMSIETALSDFDPKWLKMYQDNTGLPGNQKQAFVNEVGLVAEPPINPTMEGWEQMLKDYGPIWVTTDEQPGKGWAIHARIMIGIKGDGTESGTKFTIIDPAGGRKYEEPFATFYPKYEEEVRETGYTRIQILHWPSMASGIAYQQSTQRRIRVVDFDMDFSNDYNTFRQRFKKGLGRYITYRSDGGRFAEKMTSSIEEKLRDKHNEIKATRLAEGGRVGAAVVLVQKKDSPDSSWRTTAIVLEYWVWRDG